MAKWCNDDVLDAALDEIANNCNLMVLCNAMPTDRNDAVNVKDLADVAMAAGDFAISNGAVDGRMLTIAAKLTVTVDHDGTGVYLALVDAARLLYVTPCASQPVVTTEPVNILSWTITFRDPT